MRSPLLIAGALLLLTTCDLSVSSAATWTVTSTADSGPGTLRSAIDSANASGAARDTIDFSIAGAGAHEILPISDLPVIQKDFVLIDGYTQPGAAANTLVSGNDAVMRIMINPASATKCLSIDAESCTVRGLVIYGVVQGIELIGASGGHVIEGNFIGVDETGLAVVGNDEGILINNAGGNRIGGSSPAARNVISGNTNYGILIAVSNGNVIQGNYIGTDRHGTTALPNGVAGIQLSGADSNSIGGATPGTRNIISGNDVGIRIVAGSTGNIVAGNFVGTDRSGTAALGNTNRGIDIVNSPGNVIGGTTPAAANVISCNVFCNLLLFGNPATGNVITGNLIGTDVTGLVALSNPGIGISLSDADSNFVGQTGVLRNVLGGMTGIAIWLELGADGNIITSNSIGVGVDGITPIPNAGAGILIDGSSFNQIGDTNFSVPGNIIANATGGASSSGIRIAAGSIGNQLLVNAIRDNAGLGIDLEPVGVNANDVGDGDSGPNDLQNYPVLTAGKILAGGTYVVGSLNSMPGTTCFIQIYANLSCDPSGYGEGRAVVDTFSVSVGGSGVVSFAHNLINDVGDTVVLTATATNPAGSTSEFSACVPVVEAAVGDTLRYFLFSPVHMVITDPVGDSIGIDSASNVIFNTVLNGSTYDTTSDLNSSDLSGPDGSSDDVVTIPNPIAGDYVVRLYREEGAEDTLTFTMGIRIDGNQMITPDDYFDQAVSALGTTVSTTFVWTAATTLPGDCNADGNTTAADIIYLVNFVFKSGPETVVSGHGDVNCTGTVTSADVIYLVNYVFKSGLSPCSHTAG